MRRLSILCVLLGLCGCSREEGYVASREPTCEPDANRAAWIAHCIEAANPKSDEEPEDWLGLCERMAVNALCPRAWYVRHWTKRYPDTFPEWGPYLPCERTEGAARQTCIAAGWSP